MNNAAVLHVNTCNSHSDAPTMRIARYVAQSLDIPLIHDVPSAHVRRAVPYDVLFVSFGVLKFSKHRDDALRIYGNARQPVQLMNDYMTQPDSRFKKLNPAYHVWGTVPDIVAQRGGAYVNWNMLTWDSARKPVPWPRSPSLFYYGAFRNGRETALRTYYSDDAARGWYPVVFSANPRNKTKFAALNPSAAIFPKMDYDDIARQYMTVYMEDEDSHALYCSLANRFYECLHLGVPMVFDYSTVNTLTRAGIHNDVKRLGWYVHNRDDVARLMPHARTIALLQRRLWGQRDYLAELGVQLRTAAKAYKLATQPNRTTPC